MLAVFPAAAGAATARVEQRCGKGYCLTSVHFEAAPGEVNELAVVHDEGGIVFRDARAPVGAGERCVSLSPNEVRCPRRGEAALVRLGDGDDSFQFTAGTVNHPSGPYRSGISAYGGAGRDVLAGGDGDDYLEGGSGVDTLRGGIGNDFLEGDWKQAAEDDELDGGLGFDTVTYLGRRAPVRVDLANPAPDGSAGEADRFTAIERARGGEANDVLAGDEGPNQLAGGGGDDRLRGRGGDDLLEGTSGRDVLIGGDGRDTLASQVFGSSSLPDPEGSSRLDCGPGDDGAVDDPVLGDLVDESCERVRISVESNTLALGLPLAGFSSPVLRRATPCEMERCEFPAELRLTSKPGRRRAAPGTVVGRGEAAARGGHAAIRLNSRGRALLRERRRIYVQYVVESYPGHDDGFTMLLRAPGQT